MNLSQRELDLLLGNTKKPRIESKKIIIDGHEFASQNEGLIYWEFKHDPEIKIIKLQPKFELTPKFERFGKTYQPITYKADFRIEINGLEWIIEVKSIGTLKANSKSYPMRRKLFLMRYADLRFREIIFSSGKRTEKIY